MQQPTGNPATAGGIILIVCALAILIGTVTRSWFGESERGSSFGIGLYGVKFCGEDWETGKEKCESHMWTDKEMKGAVKAHVKGFGFLGFIGGLASAVVTGLFGAMALARATRKIPVVLGIVFYSIAAFAMFAFVVSIVTERGKAPDPSWSMFLGLGGITGAFVILLAMIGPIVKRERGGGQPMMMMMQQPMQPQMGQPCPRCGQPLQFVAQYQRWFCPRCQQYV